MTAPEVLITGRIATLAGDAGFGWAEAIAIRAGRVVAAGQRHDLEPLAGAATRRIALAPDEVALPGLTDSHLHLAETALAARRIDLADAPTLDDGLAPVSYTHLTLPTKRIV